MLVLTRKENESIRVGDDIFITVSRIQGNRVRFAIEAPKEVRIVRSELQTAASVGEVAKRLDNEPDADPNSGEFGYIASTVAEVAKTLEAPAHASIQTRASSTPTS